MSFNSFAFFVFLTVVFIVYWGLRSRLRHQTLWLLLASYFFYGWWDWRFLSLILISTAIDFYVGRALEQIQSPSKRKRLLTLSVASNLSVLGFFKYFNFFAENLKPFLAAVGFEADIVTLHILLPIGISFYTFQSMSYTIDIYRGKLKPVQSFTDFAVFVSMFPQLVAGPIERASALLPQIQTARKWNLDLFLSAWPLLVWGYFKKIVIADNMAVYADKVFMLQSPSWPLLLAGTFAFTLQIFADFSAYTNIAQGSARLLGFRLSQNFNRPYLAISPSDFWRRWHITFSTWIRDYLYIPLGGSRGSVLRQALVLLAAMGLSGLWHGAAWNFVIWGWYHALLIFIYHRIGWYGNWRPKAGWNLILAWGLMMLLTIFGWTLFRSGSMTWLIQAVRHSVSSGVPAEHWMVASVITGFVVLYTLPLVFKAAADHFQPKRGWLQPVFYGFIFAGILILSRTGKQDFIYFQF